MSKNVEKIVSCADFYFLHKNFFGQCVLMCDNHFCLAHLYGRSTNHYVSRRMLPIEKKMNSGGSPKDSQVLFEQTIR